MAKKKKITVVKQKRPKKPKKSKKARKAKKAKKGKKGQGQGQYSSAFPTNRQIDSNQYWQLRAEIAGAESKVGVSMKDRKAEEDRKDDEVKKLRREVDDLNQYKQQVRDLKQNLETTTSRLDESRQVESPTFNRRNRDDADPIDSANASRPDRRPWDPSEGESTIGSYVEPKPPRSPSTGRSPELDEDDYADLASKSRSPRGLIRTFQAASTPVPLPSGVDESSVTSPSAIKASVKKDAGGDDSDSGDEDWSSPPVKVKRVGGRAGAFLDGAVSVTKRITSSADKSEASPGELGGLMAKQRSQAVLSQEPKTPAQQRRPRQAVQATPETAAKELQGTDRVYGAGGGDGEEWGEKTVAAKLDSSP